MNYGNYVGNKLDNSPNSSRFMDSSQQYQTNIEAFNDLSLITYVPNQGGRFFLDDRTKSQFLIPKTQRSNDQTLDQASIFFSLENTNQQNKPDDILEYSQQEQLPLQDEDNTDLNYTQSKAFQRQGIFDPRRNYPQHDLIYKIDQNLNPSPKVENVQTSPSKEDPKHDKRYFSEVQVQPFEKTTKPLIKKPEERSVLYHSNVYDKRFISEWEIQGKPQSKASKSKTNSSRQSQEKFGEAENQILPLKLIILPKLSIDDVSSSPSPSPSTRRWDKRYMTVQEKVFEQEPDELLDDSFNEIFCENCCNYVNSSILHTHSQKCFVQDAAHKPHNKSPSLLLINQEIGQLIYLFDQQLKVYQPTNKQEQRYEIYCYKVRQISLLILYTDDNVKQLNMLVQDLQNLFQDMKDTPLFGQQLFWIFKKLLIELNKKSHQLI